MFCTCKQFISSCNHPPGAQAAGIEGIKPAELVEGGFGELRRKNQDFLDKGAEAFENSEILKTLRERSTANKAA